MGQSNSTEAKEDDVNSGVSLAPELEGMMSSCCSDGLLGLMCSIIVLIIFSSFLNPIFLSGHHSRLSKQNLAGGMEQVWYVRDPTPQRATPKATKCDRRTAAEATSGVGSAPNAIVPRGRGGGFDASKICR